MSRFNQKKETKETVNCAGGKAFKVDKQLDLYMRVCTSSLTDLYYKNVDQQFKELQSLIATVDPEFVAKLAVYSREQMYLRTIPIVIAVELAKRKDLPQGLISKLVTRIIQRPDEIGETLAYYAKANNRKDFKKLGKLSKQIQKGVANSFAKFNEYGFAKYNNKNKEVTLKDALCICHPKPKNDEQAMLFKKICEDNLTVPYTWEVELSKAGQEKTSKKVVWEQLIDSKFESWIKVEEN